MRLYPPVAGGPVYWWLRRTFTEVRRKKARLSRAIEMNWDVTKFATAGVPKTSYNPSVNEWMWNVDTEFWNGPGAHVWWYIGLQGMYTFFWAFSIYTMVERWYVNGKIDTFSKWKKKPE